MATKEYNKKYYQLNKDRYKKWGYDYYHKNKSRLYGMNRNRHLHRYRTEPAYRTEYLEKQKKYRDKNRESAKKYFREYTKKIRDETLKFVGGKYGIRCRKCGFVDKRALQIDHVFGGGCKEIRNFKNNRKYLNLIKSKPERYQILCANCNWIKRHTNFEGHSK